MLIAFVALAVVLAYSTRRPVWQKIFLTLSAVPVAVLCNSFRVTLTGWMWVHAPAYAEGAAHQYLGLLMLIPAMGMQLVIGWMLDRVFIEKPDDVAAPTGATG
jgi:exosortase/archaeosortase family protein